MRIAVTGALGSVGRGVVPHLRAHGHAVVAIDRVPPPTADPSFVVLDIADHEGLVRAIDGCDALVHLAAISGPGRHPDHVVHDHNVTTSYHALRAAAEVGIARVAQASSVNAIGGRFSRRPRYDYLPVDEAHPTYAEDPYSLSKWICEQQADAIARRYEDMTIASLRLHGIVDDRSEAASWPDEVAYRHLWGYTTRDAAARAFRLSLTAPFVGHEVFYIVAPRTAVDVPSLELKARWYPDVPLKGELSGNRGFFDTTKAERILGWRHDPEEGSA